MTHSRSGSTINEPHRLVLFIGVGHGKGFEGNENKFFGFVGTETNVRILVFSSSSAKLLFTSLFNFFQSLTAAKYRFYDSPFFIFGFYFAAMRIVIYEIMMYFQHKINVLMLYPLRETTNRKYFLCIFTFWSSEKLDI